MGPVIRDRLQYHTKQYVYTRSRPLTLTGNYIANTLPLVNKGHISLNPELIQNAWNKRGISLIAKVRPEDLSGYSRLQSDITTALPEDACRFSDPDLLHFTVAGYGNVDMDFTGELYRNIRSGIDGLTNHSVMINGVWMSNFVTGRVFLRVFPESINMNTNWISKIIEATNSQDWKVYPLGFLQLRRDLNSEEADKLFEIIREYEEHEFIREMKIKKLILIEHTNDLLINGQVIGEFGL